jgi:hypothetical protein
LKNKFFLDIDKMKHRFENKSGIILALVISVIVIIVTIVLSIVLTRPSSPKVLGTLGNQCASHKGDLICVDGSVCSGNYCVKCTKGTIGTDKKKIQIDTCAPKGMMCDVNSGKCVPNIEPGPVIIPKN